MECINGTTLNAELEFMALHSAKIEKKEQRHLSLKKYELY